MSEDTELWQRLELLLNEQRADLAFMRLLLQKFLLRLAASPPSLAEERLRELRNDLMATLERPSRTPRDPGENRFHELTRSRAEAFFRELEGLLLEARTMTGERGRH